MMTPDEITKMFSPSLKKMGINPNDEIEFKPKGLPINPIDWTPPIIRDPIVPIEDIKINEDGTFEYEGKRVIVYIRDQAVFNFSNTSEYKYHLAWCSTLNNMYNQKRYDKYVISERTDETFVINRIINGAIKESNEKLHVCKNCLQKLNWKSYSNSPLKEIIYENFSLEEFFKKYKNNNKPEFPIIPEYNSQTAVLNNYTEDWEEISRQTKRSRKFTCEECGEYFPNGKGLHVHHRNTIKSDNRPSNLQVLCPDCHQKMHNHKILGSSKWKNLKPHENENVHNLTLFDE